MDYRHGVFFFCFFFCGFWGEAGRVSTIPHFCFVFQIVPRIWTNVFSTIIYITSSKISNDRKLLVI